MASQGNLELKSSSLVGIYDAVFNYQKDMLNIRLLIKFHLLII